MSTIEFNGKLPCILKFLRGIKDANKEPLFLRVSVSIDPFTDWRQIILSSSHLAAAHPAAAEIRSPSAMRKDGVCERAAEVSVCVCESQSGCSMWHYSARLSDRIRHLGGRFGRNLPGPSARQEMGPPCLMPWQPDRKKHKGPTLGASYCICVWDDGTYIYIYIYSGAKKYLVSHQLCKFSHLKRWERPVIFIIGIPQLWETK